jgi:hypothetical protein
MAKAKDNSNTAVATREDTLPDYIKKKEGAGSGMGNMDSSDCEVPRIKLIHPNSPEVTEGDVDVKPGDFFHNIMDLNLGQSIKVVPIVMSKSYILWKPRWDGGGILARANDGEHWVPANAEFTVRPYDKLDKTVKWVTKPTVKESGLDQWGSTDRENAQSAPAANKMINILVYLPDHPAISPCAISLQRSQLKAAGKLVSKLQMTSSQGVDLYALQFNMKSVEEKNKKGEQYLNYKFIGDGHPDKESYEACEKIFDTFAEGFAVKAEDFDENSAGEAEVEEQEGARAY